MGLRKARDEVMQSVNDRQFPAAYRLAQQRLPKLHHWVEAQFLIALTANLVNRHQVALRAQRDARNCQNYKPLVDGDFSRDHALWAIRNYQLALAEKHLAVARDKHWRDRNRMAYLILVEARLRYAEGKHAEAVDLHQYADLVWHGMREEADTQWMFVNCVYWLKTLVAQDLRYMDHALHIPLRPLLEKTDDYGSRQYYFQILSEVHAIFGNKFDDLVQRLVQTLNARR